MGRDSFTERLHTIMLLPAQREFQGVAWITGLSEVFWETRAGDEDWVDSYLPLTKCLYDIGFIGVASRKGLNPTYSFQDPSFLDRPSNLEDTCCFFVHPAFHLALDIRSAE